MADMKSRIVVALDQSDARQALKLIDLLGEAAHVYKIGAVLLASSGPDVIRVLQRLGKQIFLDIKLYDTPKVVYDTLRAFSDIGADFATIHTLGGPEMCEAAGLACRGSHMKLIGVTLLTTIDQRLDFGWQDDVVSRLVRRAVDTRLAGVLCAPNALQAVKKSTPEGFVLVTAGIRFKDEPVFEDDQKQIASPEEAFLWGASLLIIGRPITSARDPLAVIKRLHTS